MNNRLSFLTTHSITRMKVGVRIGDYSTIPL